MPWIFAYGSLMGDHALGGFPGHPARIAGRQRAFDNVSTRRWGTPEVPCPILGLAEGAECWGVAFEIPKPEESRLLRALEKRDEGRGVRRQRGEVELRSGDARQAWLFTTPPARRDPRWSDPDALEGQLRRARGLVGTGVEYIRTLIHSLELHGIDDPLVRRLWTRLQP